MANWIPILLLYVAIVATGRSIIKTAASNNEAL